MGKTSKRTTSLLGLVLMAASAVTAAAMPGSPDNKIANNGTLRATVIRAEGLSG